jgi:hypothetical protein
MREVEGEEHLPMSKRNLSMIPKDLHPQTRQISLKNARPHAKMKRKRSNNPTAK